MSANRVSRGYKSIGDVCEIIISTSYWRIAQTTFFLRLRYWNSGNCRDVRVGFWFKISDWSGRKFPREFWHSNFFFFFPPFLNWPLGNHPFSHTALSPPLQDGADSDLPWWLLKPSLHFDRFENPEVMKGKKLALFPLKCYRGTRGWRSTSALLDLYKFEVITRFYHGFYRN